jgi:hypothetical protein
MAEAHRATFNLMVTFRKKTTVASIRRGIKRVSPSPTNPVAHLPPSLEFLQYTCIVAAD